MVFAEFTFSSHLLRNCKRRKSLPTHCEAKYPKPKPKGEERCRRIDAVNLNKKSPLKLLIVYLFRGTTPWPACSCFIVQEQRALTFFYGAWSEEILYILKSLCTLMDTGLPRLFKIFHRIIISVEIYLCLLSWSSHAKLEGKQRLPTWQWMYNTNPRTLS